MELRTAKAADLDRIAALDDSFTTDTVFEVVVEPEGFALRPTPVDPPLHKVFPPDDDPDGTVFVAADGPRVHGFVVVDLEDWHRRLVIQQVTVAPSHRGRGIGRALVDHACAHGRAHGALTAWLETSTVNVPAVRAYQRMGFALCGLDTTFYRGTPTEGETALFFARAL
ncbi:N-acetyltransferase [Saccharothrix sp. ALI-22-I]|uniref:GNAT family N-acetyltransferase n=1 Tax=Saccharothrix sp. ALI-22-I TaxID=1933778 RepID=UPI00097C3C16|nr:GNAT family N-acetyltransferase [Saccharothrix sp. ALI-22-I]ONI83574.1 N-acetyltransferase [Saccharothrix sp. ALI-22-I]